MYEYRNLTPEERQEVVRQRRERGYPLHDPPHPLRDQPFYLLTAACYEHKHRLTASERRHALLDDLFAQFTERGLNILAWVILTNHYHLLVHVTDFDLLSDIFRLVHGRTAHQWNREDATQGSKVWYRFTDRAIRSERHYYTTLNYIHYNPVKHGLVPSPYDWQPSSVHWYLECFGREWLRDLWSTYPLRDYGRNWDEF